MKVEVILQDRYFEDSVDISENDRSHSDNNYNNDYRNKSYDDDESCE